MEFQKVTLIHPSSPFLLDEAVFPPLGILYLAAVLKQNGVDVECLDEGLGHVSQYASGDVIGVSFTTPQANHAYQIAHYFSSDKDRRLVAGGAHATHCPQECLYNDFDFVVQGYGENKLLELLGIPARYKHINDFPYPDRDALPIKEYRYLIDGHPATVIMTSRGCPFDCSFCGRISKEYARQRASKTLAEIYHVHLNYGFKAFMIFDDTFTAGRSHLELLAEGLDGTGFIFRCFGRANNLSLETCLLLKKMGVVEVGIGIETGSNIVLNKNFKGTTRSMNTRAVQNLHEAGIRAKAFLIVGLPGETLETVNETASWIREAQPDDVDISIFQPMPGSPIWNDPLKYNIRILGDTEWYKGTPGKYNCVVETEGLKPQDIIRLRDLLEKEFKDPKKLK